MTRHRIAALFILGAAICGAVGYGFTRLPSSVTFTILPPQPTPLPLPTSTAASVRCHIVGAVHKPGVYTLPPTACIQDAIQAAGGPTADADLDSVNLAAVIEDHQQILIPRQLENPQVTYPGGEERSDDGLVNINTADSETLQTLPGIGPVLAERIIDFREEYGPFTTVDGLIAIKGIGESKLENLRPLITVGR